MSHTVSQRTPHSRVFVLVALAFAAFATACSGVQVKSESELETLNLDAYPTLVMAEPEFTFAHEPSEVYLRSYQLVQTLTEGAGLPVIAPWEVDVEEGAAWPHGREHLAQLMESNGVDANRIVVLRFRVEQNGTLRNVRSPGSMGGGYTSTFEPDVKVELIVETFGGTELARVWREYSEDVFADGPEVAELRPMLREAIDAVAMELGERFEAAFEGGARGALAPIDAMYNARQVFTYGGGAGEALNAQWQDMSEEGQRVERFRWLRLFEPGLDLAHTERFDANAPGILLTRVSGVVADAGLRTGDYVVAVGNQAALGEHVVHRMFLSRQRGDSLPIDVLRDGNVQRLYIDLSGR